MKIVQDKTQEIISDFADEIRRKKRKASPVESIRIDFRNGMEMNREETVYLVPLDLLLLRKENGRISSGVKTHERVVGMLNPTDDRTQEILKRFLLDKDKEKTEELKKLLEADGQREPGVITADGFLINGNRRKVALLELRAENPSKDKFQSMKVVILPGVDDEGGPPTLKEIEQIENRYQLQTDGKAEYHGFDAALSIRDKEERGYALELQMRDNPQYRSMPAKQFEKEAKKRRREILEPLVLVDEYLETIGRSGDYDAVSHGPNEGEGRWQAFVDLHRSFWTKASSSKGQATLGVDAVEAGQLMEAAYAIIRARNVPRFGKLHMIMRDLGKYTKSGGKQHLLDLRQNIKHELPAKDRIDKNGEQLSREVLENKWKAKYETEITKRLIKAKEASESQTEQEAPLTLLSDALKKLNHGNMLTDKVEVSALKDALKLINQIKNRSEELKHEFYSRLKKSQDYRLLDRD